MYRVSDSESINFGRKMKKPTFDIHGVSEFESRPRQRFFFISARCEVPLNKLKFYYTYMSMNSHLWVTQWDKVLDIVEHIIAALPKELIFCTKGRPSTSEVNCPAHAPR